MGNATSVLHYPPFPSTFSLFLLTAEVFPTFFLFRLYIVIVKRISSAPVNSVIRNGNFVFLIPPGDSNVYPEL